MTGQGMSDNELVELLQNTLPQDLTPQQIATLRQAIRSNPQVREALLDELRLETGLASRLAPDHMGAEEFVEKIANLAAERSRTKWIWLSTMFILVGGIVVGGVSLAWNIANEPVGPEVVIDDRVPVKDAILKDGKPLDDGKTKPKILDTGKGDAVAIKGNETPKPPVVPEVETIKPLSALPLPPYSPAWRLFDDAASRGDRRWAARIHEVVRPIGASRMNADEREGHYSLNGKFEMLPPTEEGRAVRLRFSDTRRMKLTFWGETQGVLIELKDDRMLRGFTVTRGPVALTPPHNLPVGTDDRFYRRDVVARIDPQIDFSWGDNSPGEGIASDQFAVRWEGILKVPTAGRYRFIATTDDGVMLSVAGKRIIADWISRAAAESIAEIDLPAGDQDLLMEYFDSASTASAKLEWEGPGVSRQVIPSSALRTARQEGRQPGLRARYFSGPEIVPVGADIVRQVADDGHRWRLLREGGMDLRYQDGQVVIARGDLVLLTVPMEEPPRELTLETEGRFWLAEELRFRPLDLKTQALARAPIETRQASELSWRFPQPEREKIVTITNHEDGSVSFTRNDPQTTHDFRVETPIEMLGGAEVTLEVTNLSPGMMLQFQSPVDNNTLTMGLGKHKGDTVLCYNGQDRNDIERRHREGWIVGERFWVRARFTMDGILTEASSDGVNFAGFDYRELDINRNPAREALVAVYGHHDKGERTATIRTVSLRRLTALEQLADPAIVASVSAITDELLKRPLSLDNLLDLMAAEKPAQVTADAWRVACEAVILQSPVRAVVRRDAAYDIIRTAIRAGVDAGKIAAALSQLPQVMAMSREDHRAQSYPQYLRLYDELAMRIWARGDRDQFAVLLDRFYATQDLGWQMRWYAPKQTAPPVLTRLHLFHLWDRGRFDDLRQSAMRYDFIASNPAPWIDRNTEDYATRLLCAWMLSQSNEQLADIGVQGEIDRRGDRQLPRQFPPHPLIVDSDRESMNTVSELLAAVNSGAIDHAGRILTRQSLPDGIAPVDQEGRLFKATYVLLRELLDRNVQLADRIKQQYAAVGLIRLRQAMDMGRLESLEALATQFHGTEAAQQALSLLADRDLSMGDFFSAAARYDALLEKSAGADRPVIAAKRRLAMAMAGEDSGQPVRQPVKLGDREFSPGDFESLVSTLIDERRKSGFMPDNIRAEEQQAFEPRPVKLATLMDVTPARDTPNRSGQRIREVAYAHKGSILLIHQHAKLTAYDLVARRVLWQKHESGSDLSSFVAEPATPLIFGNRVFVPFHREKRTELTCYDLNKGDVIWRQVFDDALAGDPIAVGPWLYLLSVRREVGNYGDLILRRLAPETGESVMAKRVVRVRHGEELFRVGRPQLVSDALVFRTGASLVSCDLLGSPRWIRRLSLVPPTVDSALFDNQATSDFIIDGDHIVATSPGSPHVVCINAKTGEEVWSHLQPRLRRLVARRGDHVVIATINHLEAIDIKTGQLVWQTPLASDLDAVLPAGKDMLVTIMLTRVENMKTDADRQSRRIEWINALDGKVVKTETIEDHHRDVFDIENLYTDGKVIVGVSNISTRNRNGKLVVIEGK